MNRRRQFNLKISRFHSSIKHGMQGLCAAVAAAALASGAAAGESKCNPADLNDDGVVDGADLGILLSAWGPCDDCEECPADLNGDCKVDGADLGLLLASWGTHQFDYGPQFNNSEAHQIGLEMHGPDGSLTLSEEDYERIVADIGHIRDFEPSLEFEYHSGKWIPTHLIIKLLPEESSEEFDCANDYYQLSEMVVISKSLQLYLLKFPKKINTEALAVEYSNMPNIQFAEPDQLIGGSNFWEVLERTDDVWSWRVENGWHDCWDGCDCRQIYYFDVDSDGNVTLVHYEEWYAPWCEV